MLFRTLAFIILVSELLLFYTTNDNSNFLLSLSFLGLLILVITYFINEKNSNRILFSNWIRPSYIVLIGLLIVNCETILNVLVGLAPLSLYLRNTVFDPYMSKVQHLGIIAIAAFLLGNSVSTKSGLSFDAIKMRINSPHMTVWCWLSVIFFCLFVYNINIASFISGSHYQEAKGSEYLGGETSSYFETLLNCTIIIILSTYTSLRRNAKDKSFKGFLKGLPTPFLIVSLLYILLRLLSGDRGPVIYTLMTYFYAYILITKKRIKFVFVATGIVIAAIFVTLLGFARGMDTSMSFGDRFNNAYNMSMTEDYAPSIIPATQELAGSINCNFIAVRDIDTESTTYKYGTYHLFELLGIIPGSSSILTNFFGVNLKDTQSSEYLTISYFGRNYPFNLGTTAVAEPYLDFGVLGVIIVCWLFGILYKQIDNCYVGRKKVGMHNRIILFKLSAWAIYVGRSSFFQMFTSALYIILIYYAISFILDFLEGAKD